MIKDKIKVLFYPDNSGMNPYITIMKNSLSEYKDIVVEPFIYNEKYYWKNKNSVDIVYLNWFENIQTESILRTLVRALRRLELVYFIKLQNIKVIVVIHNRVPHNAKNIKIIKWFSRKLYCSADRLVVLSKATRNMMIEQFGQSFYQKVNNRISHVPHPDYYGVYKDNKINYREKFFISDDDFVCLFFGSISPYKNVELVIEAAKKLTSKYSNIKFVIAGGCDDIYGQKLKKQIGKNKGIVFSPQKLGDDELTSIIRTSNVVVMPLDTRSSLNSTTLYLTLTCERNIICPKIASTMDFNTDNLYLYTYNNMEEHYEKLKLMIETAYKEFFYDREVFDKKIRDLSIELKQNNSKNEVGRRLYEAFEKVMDTRGKNK